MISYYCRQLDSILLHNYLVHSVTHAMLHSPKLVHTYLSNSILQPLLQLNLLMFYFFIWRCALLPSSDWGKEEWGLVVVIDLLLSTRANLPTNERWAVYLYASVLYLNQDFMTRGGSAHYHSMITVKEKCKCSCSAMFYFQSAWEQSGSQY